MLTALLLAAVAAAAAPPSAARTSRPAPDLSIHAWALEPPRNGGEGRAAVPDAAPSACSGEVCQPVVAVPGFEPRWERPSRTLLAAIYLERARLEPFATLAWMLVATGLQLDWQPPAFAGPSHAPTRWGSFSVRVRLRLDADNQPVVLRRSAPPERQRPARRKST